MTNSIADFIRRTPAVRAALKGPIALRRTWIDYRQRSMRAMLGRMESLVTSDVRVRIDEFEGEFLLGPQSHLLHRMIAFGHYEPELVKLFLDHLDPDRDVIDVGANVGMFTVLAGKHLRQGRVLAAEPTSAAFRRLRENAASNGVEAKVIFYQGLVSDKAATSTLNIVPGREEYSSVGAIVHPAVAGQKTRSEEIVAKPLDQLVAENDLKPALIKIDVEGAEGRVFAGAEETLRTHRPVVISEFSRSLLKQAGSSPEAILAMLEKCNYEVRDPRDNRLKPGSADYRDIIAIPR